jgi:cardiolipin synthase
LTWIATGPETRLTLLRNGTEYFPALQRESMPRSTRYGFETYIFLPTTPPAVQIAAASSARPRAGQGALMVDGWGASSISPPVWSRNGRRAGVELLEVPPEVAPWHFARTGCGACTDKLCQIDRRVGFVGWH